MLILARDIGWGCRCPMSCCNLDLTFDFTVVAVNLKNVWAICQMLFTYFGDLSVS